MAKWSSCVFLCLAVILGPMIARVSYTSQYDPHPYPLDGPFFEGWYNRLTDTDNERSLGVLFGRVLPRSNVSSLSPSPSPSSAFNSSDVAPMTYIGILRSNGTSSPMIVAEAYPRASDIEVTVRGGQSVKENPTLQAPAYFEWVARPYGYFNVTPNSTVFNFTVQGVNLVGNFSGPVLWDTTGRGPEGWLTNIPFLPIHWFVYSLGSPGTYRWTNLTSGQVLSGNAHAHQEKNWGVGFPAGWIWTQAFNRTANATFAGSFGVVSFFSLPSTVPAHLFGYRNFARNISVNFRPDNSYATLESNPCEGTAVVHVYSPFYKVKLTMNAPNETFQKCLRGPVETGFRYNLVETYVATVRVTIKELWFWGYNTIEDQLFNGAAYEFGRDFLCPENPCSK